ncbi:hypothetical protein EIP91_008607 [Steccherinum ochraceum]|uniref:Methyltransferase domain-containing protein n=1 Tax=Steccherinum ochraceum TaxID=92696 RepID=A0A4R0RKU6_9APHY|nr:hypothetical protein EIP91_008607 [Steccherinum ochraceum]
MKDNLPDTNEGYGTKEYWDERYSKESEDDSFDWFKTYSDIAPIIRELVPSKEARILMLGCGNSKLSEEMYDDGYKNIVNTDYSGILIEKMRQKHVDTRPEMEWHEMDVRDLNFDSDSFDVAIDKGTMDAMMTAKGDVWDPPEDVIESCTKEVDEVLRLSLDHRRIDFRTTRFPTSNIMHSALLIDEIFGLILDKCSDWDYQNAATRLARTHSTFKDLALDRVWRRLDGPEPLTKLLEDGSGNMQSTIPDNHSFHSYAARVKHLCLRQEAPALSSSQRTLLPNLTSVILGRPGCSVPTSWILSEHLQELQVITGNLNEGSEPLKRSAHIDSFLRQWKETYPNAELSRLGFRGWISPSLVDTIMTFTSLRFLALLSGSGVTSSLLHAITLFPHLEELNIHTNGITIDEFRHTAPSYNDTTSFPTLHTLLITGNHSVVGAVLDLVQFNTLEKLSIEVDSPTLNVPAWKPILQLIAAKAAQSLHQLDLRNIEEADEMVNSLPGIPLADMTFTIEALRILAPLRCMRSFAVDTMLPPDLTNAEMEEMLGWWPRLEKLFLSTLPFLDAFILQPSQPRTTIAILPAIAKRCPLLRELTLPLDPNAPIVAKPSSTPKTVIEQHNLRQLTFGHFQPSELSPTFLESVLSIFPRLDEVDCDSECGTKTLFNRTLSEISLLLPSESHEGADKRTAGTADGLANGQ